MRKNDQTGTQVRVDEALGPFSFFRITNIVSIWFFPSNDMLTVFPHSNAWATHVDLAINWVKVITGT